MINNLIKKWAKDLNKHFFKEYIHMSNKYVKLCLTSLVIRKMQIKTTMRYQFTPTRMALDNNKYWWRYGETEIVIQCWWGWKIA
jgi:hypothetical protein